jgi:hypothetical protein
MKLNDGWDVPKSVEGGLTLRGALCSRKSSKETHLNRLSVGSMFPQPRTIQLGYNTVCVTQNEHVSSVVFVQRTRAGAMPFRPLLIGRLTDDDDIPKVSSLWWHFLESILEFQCGSHYCLSQCYFRLPRLPSTQWCVDILTFECPLLSLFPPTRSHIHAVNVSLIELSGTMVMSSEKPLEASLWRRCATSVIGEQVCESNVVAE